MKLAQDSGLPFEVIGAAKLNGKNIHPFEQPEWDEQKLDATGIVFDVEFEKAKEIFSQNLKTADKVAAEKKGDCEAWSDSADRVESPAQSKMWGVTAIHVTAPLLQDP
ncbi:MAG: hypothetical protein JXR76_13020 [Deltaproteobacteria bacterium]|nr:hypothetical protein [Deltaproteobacteria bacterium]